MPNNLIQFILTATDNASAVFAKVGGAITSLGTKANDASGDIAGAFTRGALQADLYRMAIGKVTEGFGFLNQRFQEAQGTEANLVATTGSFAALTGKSFKDSGVFVKEFNQDIAKIAGELPGVTRDYNLVANQILSTLVPAYKRLDGSLEEGNLKTNLEDITKQMTLLGIQRNIAGGATAMFTGRFLSGAESFQSLGNLEFGIGNKDFMSEIQKQLKARGKTVDDLQQLSTRDRAFLLRTVSAKFVTPESIEAASSTVEGLIAGIQSNLIDPTSGLFGLMRDLSKASGDQTVMSAIAKSIKGLQKFFDTGSKLAKALGIPNVDPMEVLYNGINTVTGWVGEASAILENISSVIEANGGGLKGFGVVFHEYLVPRINNFVNKHLPTWLAEPIKGLTNTLDSPALKTVASQVADTMKKFVETLKGMNKDLLIAIASAAAFSIVKPAIAGNIIKGAVSAAPTAISTGASVATFVGSGIIAGAQGAGAAVSALTASIIALPGLVTTSLASVAALVQGVASILSGITLTSFIAGLQGLASFTWAGIIGGLSAATGAIATFTGAVFASGVALLTNPLVLGIAAIAGVAVLIYKYWEPIKGFFAGFGEGLMQSLGPAAPLLKGIGDATTSAFSTLGQWIGNAIKWFMDLFKPVKDTNDSAFNLGKTIGETLGGAIASVIDLFKKFGDMLAPIERGIGSLAGGIGNAAGKMVQFVTGSGSSPAPEVPTKYAGTPIESFSSAIALESSRMPSGARPVIANSSELILTASQAQGLVRGSVAAGAASKTTAINFAPVFNVNGVSDPRAIAQMALEELDRMIGQYQEGLLAP